jgi:hypothetical protein
MQNRAPFSERGADLYETPVEATRALLKAEALPPFIWEPSCGRGAIITVLRAAGHNVVATDLVDYGIPITAPGYYGRVLEHTAPLRTQAIVTNPPYRCANALDLCPRVIMLLRLAFLESESRRDILEGSQLARVHIFRNRLPMMHRAGWTGPRARSAIPFAWFVWDAAHKGPPELHRITVEHAR